MTALYSARATASAGRNGKVATDDQKLSLDLTYPKEMGGSGDGTNPEQLFAAGYAACFSNAILHVARESKIRIASAPVAATVGISPNNTGGFSLSVSLAVTLELSPLLSQEQALQLVATAHQVCPYSNGVKNNIDVKLSVNEQNLVVSQ
jgi:Ohr subfamily peroxiredoxin